MNTQDVELIAEFLVRTRQVFCVIRDLADGPLPGTSEETQKAVAAVKASLGALETELATVTAVYQRRLAVAWQQRHPEPPSQKRPTRPPNRYLVKPPVESRTLDPHFPVSRFDQFGRPRA